MVESRMNSMVEQVELKSNSGRNGRDKWECFDFQNWELLRLIDASVIDWNLQIVWAYPSVAERRSHSRMSILGRVGAGQFNPILL